MHRVVIVLASAAVVSAALPASTTGRVHAENPPVCFGEPATIVGTDGDDVLVGTAGSDVIVGLGGVDRIRAGAGPDRVCSGTNPSRKPVADNESVWGGPGDDRINGGPGFDWLLGGDGRDVIYLGRGVLICGREECFPQVGSGGANADLLYGDEDSDDLDGGDGPDSLWGGAEWDYVSGGSGNDELWGGPGVDSLSGDPGPSTTPEGTFVPTAGDDVGHGGSGGDYWTDSESVAGTNRFYGGDGNDTAQGNAGVDIFRGGDGPDDLGGGYGHDQLGGGAGDDNLLGDFGDDLLVGNGGMDTVDHRETSLDGSTTTGLDRSVRVDLVLQEATGYGTDRLLSVEAAIGGGGDDLLLGEDGSNVLVAFAPGDDVIKGRGGRDLFEYQAVVCCPGVFINLRTGIARMDRTDGQAQLYSIEDAKGGWGRDTLIGNQYSNRLWGADDNDVLQGRNGPDELHGQTGNDHLDGGPNQDHNYGGSGFDTCLSPSDTPNAHSCEQ